MGKVTGFMEFTRSLPVLNNPRERIGSWDEFREHMPTEELRQQGARCMNCGVPFCHTGTMLDGSAMGCPLNNLIPEWNDLVYHGKWYEAYKTLSLTNNFPEFTGRVCPAPCESSCVLGINEDPVMIKEIEVSITDRAFEEGWITPNPPEHRTGKKVAIVGSGPAGLACADELNKHGHGVTVFERDDRIGGLLMYGIPNMKLDKRIVERRVKLLAEEGVDFRTSVRVGRDMSADDLRGDFGAVVLACGAPKPRDLPIEGRELSGIHFAMEFLTEATKRLLDGAAGDPKIDVRGRDVIVIGGGDTGTDCVATAIRQQCRSLVQFELMPKPPTKSLNHDGWLSRIREFQVDYGQAEAAAVFGNDPREYSILTKRFIGVDGRLIGLETIAVEWREGALREIPGTWKHWDADVVLLAMGFVGGEDNTFFADLGVEITARNTIAVDEYKRTRADNVFAAGDCERGQSLIVWAIADGRRAAKSVDVFLRETVI